MAVWRTGSKPRPASAANFSGTSGGRKVVVPMDSIDLPVSRATMRMVLRLAWRPWLGPKPGGRIALHQLDVVVAVLDRVDDVLRLQVLVEVDEVVILGAEDRIGVIDQRGRRVGAGRRARLRGSAERARRRRRAGVPAVADHGRLRPHAGGGTDKRYAGGQIGGAVHVDRRVEDDLGAGVAGEIERGREADAHQHEVAVDPLAVARRLALAGDTRDTATDDTRLRPLRIDQRCAGNDAHAARPHGFRRQRCRRWR